MSTRGFRSLAMASVLWLSLVACAPKGPQTINVALTTYATTFNPETIKAGEVKFLVKNDATDLVHEFFLVKTDLTSDKLPLKDGRVDEESALMTKVGSAEDIDPGKTGEFTATLAPGHYVYFCNTANHYVSGMRGDLTIAQ